MPMITIDGQEYDFDSLPDAAKQQLQSVQFVDNELIRLGAQMAVFKTARIGYVKALTQLLNPPQPTLPPTSNAFDNEIIKFG